MLVSALAKFWVTNEECSQCYVCLFRGESRPKPVEHYDSFSASDLKRVNQFPHLEPLDTCYDTLCDPFAYQVIGDACRTNKFNKLLDTSLPKFLLCRLYVMRNSDFWLKLWNLFVSIQKSESLLECENGTHKNSVEHGLFTRPSIWLWNQTFYFSNGSFTQNQRYQQMKQLHYVYLKRWCNIVHKWS